MSRASLVLVAVLSFAIINTVFLGLHLSGLTEAASTNTTATNSLNAAQGIVTITTSNPSPLQSAFQFFLGNSPALSTASWALVGGVWIWRGRIRSRWEGLGFDSSLFDLFMKMKGAKTRISLLDSLSISKDRLQLAQELGLDWKAIDYHIVLLSRYGLVHEDYVIGNVKMYKLTRQGEILLQLLREFNKETASGKVASASRV